MPPQQSHGLLDLFDERFGFGAHWVSLSGRPGRRTPLGRGFIVNEGPVASAAGIVAGT
jgi:hypothetical protein